MQPEILEDEREIKRQVREFYDRVGWKEISDGLYQNARYEDLRPVSEEYIHRAHLRIGRHLDPTGHLFLDAGSGPIQYPEYVEYSRGYHRRVCADISITALKAARERIGDNGLFVVADVSRLPFAPDVFDAIMSLHTIHHLPASQHVQAYMELHRVLAPGRRAAVVNGWDESPIMDFFSRLRQWAKRGERKNKAAHPLANELNPNEAKGTFVQKNDPAWLKRELGQHLKFKILVWRSAGTNFLRFFIRPQWAGRFWLRVLFALEELFPRYFGERGRYPLIIFKK
jgi:ubiquinone/menaquinone biosynthesis C-methylase UbiE